jgi:hypothetical protein
MKGRISVPGLLLGAVAALAAGLLVSHYSFAWLLLGMAVGMVIGAGLMRRLPAAERMQTEGMQKGEQR